MKQEIITNARTGEISIVEHPDDAPGDLAKERLTLRVSRLQFMAALHNAGLLTAATATIALSDALTQLVWKEAAEFRRNSPVIASLGLTAAALDDLFRAAAVLEF